MKAELEGNIYYDCGWFYNTSPCVAIKLSKPIPYINRDGEKCLLKGIPIDDFQSFLQSIFVRDVKFKNGYHPRIKISVELDDEALFPLGDIDYMRDCDDTYLDNARIFQQDEK